MTRWKQRHGGKMALTPALFVTIIAYYHRTKKVASVEIRFSMDVRQTIGVRFLASISRGTTLSPTKELSPTSPTSSSAINDHGDLL